MAITEVTITARIIVLLTMSAVMILIGGTSKNHYRHFYFHFYHYYYLYT